MIESSLRATLRTTTSDAHGRVDALVGGGLVDDAGYRRYLRGMYRFIVASQAALGPGWPLEPLRARLFDDMQALGMAPEPAAGTGLPMPTDDAARLGWAYVVAGSSVGARQLLRDAETLGHGTAGRAGFLHHFARSPLWTDVLSQLSAARLDTQQADRCRAAALSAFATAEAAFRGAGDELTR
ncbi:biliverdin-producing heme oxygenase [Lysobacter sp. F6437]|uniref:biliverdin-producing heme oxygenase n=1 Tax=Lysobacter sp. F6437 TaxID=3459296 RepID=UPI00403E2547